MNLESQVCSLELSKELKELGTPQKSILSWIKKTDGTWVITSYYGCSCWVLTRGSLEGVNHEESAAYTVAELGEMLPDKIMSHSASGQDKNLIMYKHTDIFFVCVKHSNGMEFPKFFSTNEANARAMMLIYLIKNRLIEITE